jgi:hypothetical protein
MLANRPLQTRAAPCPVRWRVYFVCAPEPTLSRRPREVECMTRFDTQSGTQARSQSTMATVAERRGARAPPISGHGGVRVLLDERSTDGDACKRLDARCVTRRPGFPRLKERRRGANDRPGKSVKRPARPSELCPLAVKFAPCCYESFLPRRVPLGDRQRREPDPMRVFLVNASK